jgi:hypothetical protein
MVLYLSRSKPAMSPGATAELPQVLAGDSGGQSTEQMSREMNVATSTLMTARLERGGRRLY